METNYRKPSALGDTLKALGLLTAGGTLWLAGVALYIGIPLLVLAALWKFVFGQW